MTDKLEEIRERVKAIQVVSVESEDAASHEKGVVPYQTLMDLHVLLDLVDTQVKQIAIARGEYDKLTINLLDTQQRELDLEKQIAEGREIVEWQDAKSNPPKNPLLVFVYLDKTDTIMTGYYVEGDTWYSDGEPLNTPTLWMDIPPINLMRG